MEEEDYRIYRLDHLFRDKTFDDMRNEILEVYEANDFRARQVSSVYDYLEEKHGFSLLYQLDCSLMYTICHASGHS